MKDKDRYIVNTEIKTTQSNEINNTQTSQKKVVLFDWDSPGDEELIVNKEQEKEKGSVSKVKNDKQDLSFVRESLGNELMPLGIGQRDEELPAEAAEKLTEIETVIADISRDPDRASVYKKVMAAARIYLAAKTRQEKERALRGVRQSAVNYLVERSKSSYARRKTTCENLIAQIDEFGKALYGDDFASMQDISPNYLLENTEISDEQIDQEIRFAFKQVYGKKAALGMNLKSRRKEFKKRILDSRKAKKIRDDQEAADSELFEKLEGAWREFNLSEPAEVEDEKNFKGDVTESILAFSSLSNMNPDQSVEMMCAIFTKDHDVRDKEDLKPGEEYTEDENRMIGKVQVLEGMLSKILTWDMKEFSYKSASDFMRSDNFKENLKKLRFAKSATVLSRELTRIQSECDAPGSLSKEQRDEISARISLMEEIERDYSSRMDILTSPYYALLQTDDIAKVSDERLSVLTDDTSVPEGMRSYAKTVFNRRNPAVFENDEKGIYRRGKDMDKLLDWHRKTIFADRDYKGTNDEEEARNLGLGMYAYLAEQKVERNRQKILREKARRDEEAKKRRDEEAARQRAEADKKKEEEDKKQEAARRESERLAAEALKSEEEKKAQEEVERQRLAREKLEAELLDLANSEGEKLATWQKKYDELQAVREKEDFEAARAAYLLEVRRAREADLKNKAEEQGAGLARWRQEHEAKLASDEKGRMSLLQKQAAKEHLEEDLGVLIEKYNKLSDQKDDGEAAMAVRKEIIALAARVADMKEEDLSFISTESLGTITKNLHQSVWFLDEKEYLRGEYRREKLYKALTEGTRESLLSVIAEMTEGQEAYVSDMPLVELKDVVKAMEMDAADQKLMLEDFENIRAAKEALYTPDYFKGRALYYRDRLQSEKQDGFESDPAEVLAEREYGILYLKSVLIGGELKPESFGDLPTDTLYRMIQNVGIVKGLSDGEPDEYEKEDLRKAVNALATEELPGELKAAIESSLKITLTVTEKTVKTLEQTATHDFANAEMHRAGEDMERLNKELKEFLDQKVKEQKQGSSKKVSATGKPTWDEDATSLLGFIGDLISMTNGTVSAGDVKKLSRMMNDAAPILAKLMGEEKTGQTMFGQLVSGTSKHEQKFIMGMRNVFDSMIDKMKAIRDTKPEMQGKKLTEAEIRKLLKDPSMQNIFIEFKANVEVSTEEYEKEVLARIQEVTGNIFNEIADDVELPDLFADVSSAEEKKAMTKKQLDAMQNDMLFSPEKGQGKFIQTLANGYFKNADVRRQRLMLSHIIKDIRDVGDLNNRQRGGHYFASSLKGAGPLMQKMMQGVPERMVVPEMKEALSVVKSDLGSIDKAYVDKVLKEMQTKAGKKVKEIRIIKPLGAASIAETFLCEITGKKNDRKQVVIKIMRPDVKKEAESEVPYIRTAAMYADMTDEQIEAYEKQTEGKIKLLPHAMDVTEAGFMAQYEEIIKEFDFRNEVSNAKRGEKNYIEPKRHVDTVRINDTIPAGDNYIVMNLAQGEPVDRILADCRKEMDSYMVPFKKQEASTPGMYGMNTENAPYFISLKSSLLGVTNRLVGMEKTVAGLAYQWVKQAIFGSSVLSGNGDNFHHGDLHSGNIMYDQKKKSVTVLDYGNAAVFKDDKVNQILNMMASVAFKKPEVFVESFESLLNICIDEDKKKKTQTLGLKPVTNEQRHAFLDKIRDLFKVGSGEDSGKKIIIALTMAQQVGIKLPQEIQNFSQCEQRLENTLFEIKDLALEYNEKRMSLDRMPVEASAKNSLDSIIRLQMIMNEKDENGEYRYKTKKEGIDELIRRTPAASAELVQDEADAIKTEKELREYVKKNLPGYPGLKDEVDVVKMKALIKETKKVYYEALGYSTTGQAVPPELREKLNEFERTVMTTVLGDAFTEMVGDVAAVTQIKTAAMGTAQTPPDPSAFEELIEILGAKVEHTIEGGKSMEECIKVMQEHPEEDVLISSLKHGITNQVYAVRLTNSMYSDVAKEIRMRLRACVDPEKKKEFFSQMQRMLSDRDMQTSYQRYFEIREGIDLALKTNDVKAIEKGRKRLADCEDEFIAAYCGKLQQDMHMIESDMKKDITRERLSEEDNLPEFAHVMTQVLDKHWVRAGAKLGLKFKKEVDAITAEKAKIEAEEKAEKEEKKKGKK